MYTSVERSVEVVVEKEAIDPSLVNAMLKNNLNIVELKFDRPIQVDQLQISSNLVSNSFICNELFDFRGAQRDECTFDNDGSSISIFLDYDSILLPTDNVTLLPAKLTASSVSQSVVVLPPLLTKYPEINVVVKNQIGPYQCIHNALFLLLSVFLCILSFWYIFHPMLCVKF